MFPSHHTQGALLIPGTAMEFFAGKVNIGAVVEETLFQ